MGKIKDITGQRFNQLVVIRFSHIGNGRSAYWHCRCDCGNEKVIQGHYVASGKTKSCGCIRGGKVTHGLSDSPEYNLWNAMISRCKNPKNKSYVNYGARGIRVCDRWLKFANFIADMGRRPSNRHTIERIDNDTGYSPDNCLWATRKTQARNTRQNHFLAFQGKVLCITDWAKVTGIKPGTISVRLSSGWSIERALTERPIIGKNQFS